MGRCILDMKNFMKEMVNAPESSHGFLCRFGPCVFVEVEFERRMEVVTLEYFEAIPRDKPHCLFNGTSILWAWALFLQAGAQYLKKNRPVPGKMS